MPKVQANFSDVKSGFGVIPDGDYRCRVESVEFDGAARNPFHTITLVVDDPENTDQNNSKLWDKIYMNKKDGSTNDISLGRIKQYAEAILGEEEASGTEIDTDDFVDSHVVATVTIEDYDYEKDGKQLTGQSNRIKRISPTED